MKKLITLLLTFVLFATNTSVFAETGSLVNTGAVTNTGSVVEPIMIVGTGSEVMENKQIEQASYIYYYGQGCSHCANVDKYMKGVDGYDKLNIIKKEIYFDEDNREAYLADGKKFGFAEEDLGIPFLIINTNGEETTLFGDQPIIDHFTSILGEAPKEFNKGFILLILGLLILVSPFVFFGLSNKK